MDELGQCRNPASIEFDFWLGTWDLTWSAQQTGGDAGKVARGTNRVERVLGGCVIEENFSTDDGSFLGRSLTLHDERLGLWRQTWVDSSGAYLVFAGGREDGRMILATEPVDRNDQVVLNRMVFSDIERDTLSWAWQSSSDGGDSWSDLWNISYHRSSW